MANGNRFAVTPALAFAQPGLGQLGQAIGQNLAGQRQQEDERAKAQQFMQLVQQAQGAQDPAQKQQLMTQAFVSFPEQAQRLRQQTAYQREQAELEQVGKPDPTKDTRTSTQKEFDQYQQLKKTDPESAKEFGKAARFIDSEGNELSVHLQKRLSDSTDMAIESRSNVAEFQNLADQIEGANIGGGIFQGSWAERMKDLTGQQDAVTALRKRYNAIKGSQVVKNLPPGAASDADIALALAGFPTDNASGPQLASFLRGVAKLEERQADFQDFKANYISDNRTERGMLKAYRESQEQQEDTGVVMSNPQYGDITEADIQETMRANNMTREQVMARLGGQ